MRILCVYPALMSGWSSYNEHGGSDSTYINHGFAMLSAVLKRAGHDPFLVDLRSFSSWDQFEDVVKKADYDWSMMSWLTCDDAHARRAAEIVKRCAPNKPLIGGGIHLSVTQAREYPNIDCIVWGEGEERILDIANTIDAGGSLETVYELKAVEDLDSLPFVDRGFFNPRMEETSPILPLLPEPFVTLVAGRGCPGKCTFCAPSRELISGKRVRIRSAKHVIEEICLLNSRPGGIGSLMIHDDLFGSRRWMQEFVELWKERLPRIPFWCQLRADNILRLGELIPEMAEIGFTWVSLGLESGSQRMLDFLKKGTTVEQNIEASALLHASDVNIFGNYIIGLPTETTADLDATERMLAEIKPEYHARSVYTSYPGAHLYDWVRANNYWATDVGAPDGHYGVGPYPYDRKIKGVDYEYVFSRAADWCANYTSPLREYRGRG